jgi:hypothetical protein
LVIQIANVPSVDGRSIVAIPRTAPPGSWLSDEANHDPGSRVALSKFLQHRESRDHAVRGY